jgi:uncharacterized protein YgiB involved in biofilm formation
MKTRMRKSKYVSVLLASAATMALTACDQGNVNTGSGTDEILYGDTMTCAQDFDADACKAAYDAAKTAHAQTAPKFATKEECEAAGFTACEEAPKPAEGTANTTQQANSGGGMFMPLMMGYMMGRMMSPPMGGMGLPNQTPNTNPANKPGWNGASRPVYANRDGYLFAGGSNVGRVAPGTTSLAGNRVAMRTADRGGFGSTANRMSGGS